MFDEFAIPDLGILTGLQGGVALTQSAAVAQPVRQKLWFHVEHSPVQPAATLCRTALHQPMDVGVDDLDEDDGRQLSQRLGVATVNACGVVAITLVLEADAMDGLGGLRIDTQ